MANELDELEALTQASKAPTPGTTTGAPANELDQLADLTRAETDAVTTAANNDKFDETEYYRQNGKSQEALQFAAKVRHAREQKPAEPLKAAGSLAKGIWEEAGSTIGDIVEGGKSIYTGKPHEPKSGLGSFVGGMGKVIGSALLPNDDPAGISAGKYMSGDDWLRATKDRIDAYDKATEAEAVERQAFIAGGGKPQDFVSKIPKESVVTADERAAYDNQAAKNLEASAAIHLGAQHGANLAIKGWRGLTEWNRKDWTPKQWEGRISEDAELRDAADKVKSGILPDVERDNLTGMGRMSAMITPAVPDDVRQRLTREGTYKPENVEQMSGVADPTNLVLGEALRLPIVSKAAGAALRLSGSGAKAVGSVVDKIAGHGAGRVIATTGGTLAAYEVGKHALHGDYKPLGVALALFAARSVLRRGGSLVDDAGRELLDDSFSSPSAMRSAQGLADQAAAGTAPQGALATAWGNFTDAGQNAAAASRVARRTIQGAAIGVEGALPFAALSDKPEEAGHALAGGVAFGGALGPMGGVEMKANRAMEINKAATRILADKGGEQSFGDARLQADHTRAMASLPEGQQTYLNALRGLVSGFRGRAGEPMKIAVLEPKDFGREVGARTGADPADVAENAHAIYDPSSATVFVNKASFRTRTDAAAHETGHFVTDEVMAQMGRAYGDALRTAVEGGLFTGDKPTPAFKAFIDEYNKRTPGTPIPADKGKDDILRHRAVSEYLAETTRNILGEPNVGRFMLPKDVSDAMADKAVAMFGDAAGGGPKGDIFNRTDLPTIHNALKDVMFDLGRGLTPPARATGAPRPRATAGATAPEGAPAATGSPASASAPGPRTGAVEPNPAMPGNPSEPFADIGVSQDVYDAVRDYHIAPPGMEPRTQRTNRKRGVEGKSADRIAEERGNEWDEMFSNYAEYLRTNDLQAPADPTDLHQAVIQHSLVSDPVARAHVDAVRGATPAEPVPAGATGALAEPATGVSSIESKTREGALAPVREPAPAAHTEQEISSRLLEAERQAEADPSFAKKREKGQAAAKKSARVAALLDVASEASGGDYDLLQRRTDAGGQVRFTGRLDPESILAHRMLLDELNIPADGQAAIELLNDHVGQTVYLDYKSAPKTAEGDISGTQRREEYQASPADARKAGGAHTEQKGKAFHITGFKVWPGKGSITLTGFSPDKWIANAHKLMEHVRAEGHNPGYTGVNDPHLATDMQGYAENHANGYKGDGSAPVEGREPTPGYEPWQIPQDRFDLLNAALNFDISNKADSVRAGARENAMEAQYRALDNGITPDEETGDVNPLRAYINKSGKLVSKNAKGALREGTGDHLENVFESISPDLVTGLSTTPDGQNIIRPVGYKGDPADISRQGIPRADYAAAGFMPNERSSIKSKKGALEGETQEEYSARLKSNPASLIEEHRNEAGVPVLNGDAIIYNAPKFKAASKEDAPMIAKELYPEAKAARDAALDHLIDQPIEGTGDALVMAGGIGSGKSTISKRLKRPEFIYDTNLKSFEDATRNIDAILKSGRTVHLALVEREPGDAMRANLERFQKEGRIEYADDVGSSNAQARQNVRKLAEHYADNPAVTVEAWKNVRDTDPVRIPLSEVEDISVDAARKRAHDVLNEIENGTDEKWKGEPLSKEAASIARGTSKDTGRGLGASNERAGGVLSGEGEAPGAKVGGSPRGALSGPIQDALRPDEAQGGARGDVGFIPKEAGEVKKQRDFKTEEGKFSVYDTEANPRGRADMFTVHKSPDGWIVRNALVPEGMRRKGVASDFYAKMNEESLAATGKPLRSTQPRTLKTGAEVHELSPDAVALWDSFVDKGLAVKNGEKDYAFKDPSSIESKKDYDTHFPKIKAGAEVDGRTVRERVPNLGSIEASGMDALPGIREVSMEHFHSKPRDLFYSKGDLDQVDKLADEIGESGEIAPLIVGIDAEGPYILEGAHRLGALNKLGAKSFPAVVALEPDAKFMPSGDKGGSSIESKERNLVAIHNVSADKLESALELGGLAVPSLAITKKNMPHTGFGEISLVGDRNLIDPEVDRRSRVYEADIYSARHPQPTHGVDTKAMRKLMDELRKNKPEAARDSSAYEIEEWVRKGKEGNRERALEDARRSDLFKATFAEEHSGEKIPVGKIPEPLYDESISGTKAFREYAKRAEKFPDVFRDEGTPEYKELLQAVKDAHAEMIAKHPDVFGENLPNKYLDEKRPDMRLKDDADPKEIGMSRMGILELLSKVEDPERLWKVLPQVLERRGVENPDAAAKWIQDHTDVTTVGGTEELMARADHLIQDAKRIKAGRMVDDKRTARDAVDKYVNDHRAEYAQWVEDKMEPLFTAPTLKGKGGKKVPYTLDNIVEAMSGRMVRGQEKGMAVGLGLSRGRAAREFKNVDEMRAAQDKIVASDEFEAERKKVETKFHEATNLLNEIEVGRNTFDALDDASASLGDYLVAGDKGEPSMRSILIRRFRPSEPPSDELVSAMVETARALKKMPTEYFEAKLQRRVKFSDFRGAAVPDTAPTSVADKLRAQGLDVELYDPRDRGGEDRARAVQAIAERTGAAFMPNEKVSVALGGKEVETGKPVEFNFLRGKRSATSVFGIPDKESAFDRGYEPAGRYLTEFNRENPDPEKMETGTVRFKNPLVVPAGSYGDPSSWKRTLSEQFGGKTGKALSKAVIAAGHDGIVTVERARDGSTWPGEIVDLTTFDESKAKYMPKGALAEPGDTPPASRRAAGALANTVDDEEESAMPSFGALR